MKSQTVFECKAACIITAKDLCKNNKNVYVIESHNLYFIEFIPPKLGIHEKIVFDKSNPNL